MTQSGGWGKADSHRRTDHEPSATKKKRKSRGRGRPRNEIREYENGDCDVYFRNGHSMFVHFNTSR